MSSWGLTAHFLSGSFRASKHEFTLPSIDGGKLSVPLLPLRSLAKRHLHRKIIGLTIRKYRTKAGMSIEKLAERADLHHNYIGEIERGEKAASVDTLVKIAKGLRVRPYRLLLKL